MNIQIHEVLRRYQLSESQTKQKARLDLLTEQLFREYIDLALINNGLSERDIVCIRNWYVPIEFDPNKTDVDVFQVWLLELEASLKRVFADASQNNWIRYKSHIDALKSLPLMLAANQMQDAWAWQQMGILSDANGDSSTAKRDWLRYLERDPTTLKAVFIGLAIEGQFKRLLRYHLIVFDDAVRLIDILLDFQPNWSSLLSALTTQFTDNWPNLVTQFNALWQADKQVTQLQRRVGESWYGFYSILKSSRDLSTSTTKDMPIDEIKCMVFSGLISSWAQSGYRLFITDTAKLTKFAVDLVGQMAKAQSAISKPASLPNKLAKQQQTKGRQSQDEVSSLLLSDIHIGSNFNGNNEVIVSNFAGLLFFLNLLKQPIWQSKLVALLGDNESPSSLLNTLAHYLLPSISDDPVIKVFSGAIFQAEIDNLATDTISSEQSIAIEDFARQLKHALFFLLGQSDFKSEQQILDWLCCRKASIELQPGWVNVTFDMDCIDTEVRGAGLDLNPGYVPWLGYVVKFYYE